MNGQWGSGALFSSSRPSLSSSPVSPPTVKFSLTPLKIVLGSYLIRLGIVLGSHVKSFNITVMYYSNTNEMSCFYLFVFLFLFYMFICI